MSRKLGRKKILTPLILLAVIALVYWYAGGGSERIAEEPGELADTGRVVPGNMRITYLGHSAFLLETSDTKILMDPYSPEIGYDELSLEVDIITVSHEHLDHNYVDADLGNPKVLRGLSPDTLQWEDVSYDADGISIYNVGTYHDQEQGRYRGRNAIFALQLEEIKVVHSGDLGHVLEEDQVDDLLPVDILLISVGGHYTIGPSEAIQVMEQLDPRVVIPMHYKTRQTEAWPIIELNEFLSGLSGMKHAGRKSVTVNKGKLPDAREIWPLSP